MRHKARRILGVDTVGPGITQGRIARGHPAQQTVAARAVDTCQAQDTDEQSTVEQQLFSAQQLLAIIPPRLGQALLVYPLTCVLTIDGGAGSKQNLSRRSRQSATQSHQSLTRYDVTGFITGRRALGRSQGNHQPIKIFSQQSRQRVWLVDIGGDITQVASILCRPSPDPGNRQRLITQMLRESLPQITTADY